MRPIIHLLALIALATLTTACGGGVRVMNPTLSTIVPKAAPPPPKALTRNHFRHDRVNGLTEAAMREILAAPVFLERDARIGVVPVQDRYAVDHAVPVEEITGKLAQAMIATQHFEVVTEITTDWPGETSISGLRALAARYRSEYLLLYRHRFVERSKVNGWGWAWLTVVGGLMVPQNTIETAGVLEATLFDVKSGTLLFTLYERVHTEDDFTVWNTEWKIRQLQAKLTYAAAEKLTAKVDAKLADLVVAREAHEKAEAEALARSKRMAPTPVPASSTAVLNLP